MVLGAQLKMKTSLKHSTKLHGYTARLKSLDTVQDYRDDTYISFESAGT